ncbi:hypothetical protein AQ906_29430 [Burkholderia pseudomallei]|nr:hypothetical protein AQ906_29430 [Burkholderia pseudomallei]ONC77669.1 hypothetical protein AQ920_01220 [Burkholderia pseudomallei]
MPSPDHRGLIDHGAIGNRASVDCAAGEPPLDARDADVRSSGGHPADARRTERRPRARAVRGAVLGRMASAAPPRPSTIGPDRPRHDT